MAKTHLQTAREYGIKAALEKCGYASVEEVQRDVEALGLNKTAAAPAPAPIPSNGSFLASLKAKLGG